MHFIAYTARSDCAHLYYVTGPFIRRVPRLFDQFLMRMVLSYDSSMLHIRIRIRTACIGEAYGHGNAIMLDLAYAVLSAPMFNVRPIIDVTGTTQLFCPSSEITASFK